MTSGEGSARKTLVGQVKGRGSYPAEAWCGRGLGSRLHGFLEDLRMDASHAVDCVRASDAQMCHVDALHRTLLHE